MKCHGWLWTSGKGSSRLQLPPLLVDCLFSLLVACPCVAFCHLAALFYREFQAILSKAFNVEGIPTLVLIDPKTGECDMLAFVLDICDT